MASTADVRTRGIALPERYELVRRIANGGTASVWCAEDRLLGRRVAIKILSSRDPMAVRRFRREARAAARLSGHPHVVTIYDVGEAQEGFCESTFLVMEYLAGGTVADALRVGAVTPEDAVRWLHQTASALDYAHQNGVVHRDIKPANLLLDCNRVVHVADFGIARLGTADTVTRSGTVLGTAAYIAPERALGRPATPASDRYSLSVTAFELLVGERPFGAQQLAAQARQHIEDEPPRASEVNPALPRSLDAVLARGMAKRPEQRWATATAFAEALELALARDAARSPRPVPVHDSRLIRRRDSSRRLAALVALAAGAVGVGAVALGREGAPAPVKTHAAALTRAHRHSSPPPARASTARTAGHSKAPAQPAPAAKRETASAPAAAATGPATSAGALEARGHALMSQGDYQAAIPVLRQALAAASPGSLTYAYALFDLGRSLRLGGDPRDAVPVLWHRLQIPNQTDLVRIELQLALQALGAAVRHGGAAPSPVAPGSRGHDKRGHATRGGAARPDAPGRPRGAVQGD